MSKATKVNIADERGSDGVSLLISILVRFPQIGTINYESKNRIMRLNFIVARAVSDEDQIALAQKLASHIKAYHYVTSQQPTCMKFECSHQYQQFYCISLERDLSSLSKGELDLVISLLSERFGEDLVIEDRESLPDFMDEPGFPEDLIDSMMEAVRTQRAAKNLTAMRENGRVLVFNK